MRISDWSSDVCSSDLPAILPLFAQPLIDADLLPAIENARFLGGEARLHRKVGLRQEDGVAPVARGGVGCVGRSEEHTSELQSLMRISYAVFCLITKNT